MKEDKAPKHPNFAQKLRQLRLSRGRTQNEIAGHLGTSRNTYSSWEEGISRPKHEMGKKIAELYSISVDGLYDDSIAFERLKEHEQIMDRVDRLQTETQSPAAQPSDITPDPTKPGIYQDLVMALIRASDSNVEVTKALLDERQKINDLAEKVGTLGATKKEKDQLQSSLNMLDHRMSKSGQAIERLEHFVVYGLAEALHKKPEEIELRLRTSDSGSSSKRGDKKKTVGN